MLILFLPLLHLKCVFCNFVFINRYPDDTYFYGVFDGHAGAKAADFTAQRLPAEILLGQLDGKESDIQIQRLLYQAILSVECAFFESIDDLLAEKEKLRLQLHVSFFFF